MEYVTIDFETANANCTSACSIGIVGADKGSIIFEKYFLINPEESFSPQNIAIHGITPDMVENEPNFITLWPQIKELIDNNIVFAHSAGFDLTVLKALLDKYHLDYPNIKIGCTLRLSRIAYKGELSNFRLSTISQYLEVEHNHHNAISDASICFYLIERVKKMYQVYDVCDLFEMVNLCFGELNPKIYRGCYQRVRQINTRKVESKRLEGKIFAFTGKPRTMTKTEFKKLVETNGGLVSREIKLVINCFVIFTNPVNTHLNALKKIQERKEVLVLNEEEFLQLIHDK